MVGTGAGGWKVDVYNVAFWNSLVGVLVVFRGLFIAAATHHSVGHCQLDLRFVLWFIRWPLFCSGK